jgi:uncharacterized protein (TIGR00645 family)
MKRLELAIESIILASRWLLVVFYLGLGVALAIYALSFGKKLYEFVTVAFTLGDTDPEDARADRCRRWSRRWW